MDNVGTIYDRQGLEVLQTETCWEFLEKSEIGRVVFMDAGEPLVFPVNFAVASHSIVFLTTSGTKLEAAGMAKPMAFEIDGWNSQERRGWSVLVRGVADRVYDDDEIAVLDELGLRPWATTVERTDWVRIRVDEISGRRIDG